MSEKTKHLSTHWNNKTTAQLMEAFHNIFLTFLKNVAGAISDTLSIRKRNIGQDVVFIWYPIL